MSDPRPDAPETPADAEAEATQDPNQTADQPAVEAADEATAATTDEAIEATTDEPTLDAAEAEPVAAPADESAAEATPDLIVADDSVAAVTAPARARIRRPKPAPKPAPAPAPSRSIAGPYAIIETGGKQYRVSVGDTLSVERLSAEAGTEITIDRVLLLGGDGATRVGTPTVAGAAVTACIEDHARGEKIVVFKYKAKKRYRRRMGHRQSLTRLAITAITG